MCGIAGIFNLNGEPVSQVILRKMTDAIAHRGPDGEGFYVNSFIGLGHRRLAIIDLSPAGHQPMTDPDKKVWVAFNGEIYNFRELRKELEELGFSFRSKSDTEVILNSYRAWGIRCILRFNGMFAFALWESERNRLFLVRDRYGIKPLYYSLQGETLLFASEIKAILEYEGVARAVDEEALCEYFTFQNLYSDRTLFKGIHLLPAGHVLSLQRDGDSIVEGWQHERITCFDTWKVYDWQYWDFDFSQAMTPEQITEEECISELRRLFIQAVERSLVSDVTVGTYLSGGIDSGAIAATATRRLPRLMSFTGGFDLSSVSGLEATFDERMPAEFMSSCFGTEHYEMVMHSGDMAWVMPKLIWHLEDLRVGMCWQNYYIAQLASKFVKVVLSGTGGDEQFAGYPWRYLLALEKHRERHETMDLYYRYWQRLVGDDQRKAFFSTRIQEEVEETYCYRTFSGILDKMRGIQSGGFDLCTCLYFELKTFLHGLFVVEDKLSMAHSLETRVPFLDNDLVSFALKVPSQYKLPFVNGVSPVEENVVGAKTRFFAQSNSGKHIFRQAMRGIVPDEILDRKKQGFSPPDQSWYRGPTMVYLRGVLLDDRTLSRGFFNPETIRRIVHEHTEGKINHRLLLWSLLSFEWWNRIFFGD